MELAPECSGHLAAYAGLIIPVSADGHVQPSGCVKGSCLVEGSISKGVLQNASPLRCVLGRWGDNFMLKCI